MKHMQIEAGIDPAPFDRFTDYIAAVVETRDWVVGARLTAAMRKERYSVAIPTKRYDALKQAWEDARGYVMGYPPEMQPEWLREAVRAYRGNGEGQDPIDGKRPTAPFAGARALASSNQVSPARDRAEVAEAMLRALHDRLERDGAIYAPRVPLARRVRL